MPPTTDTAATTAAIFTATPPSARPPKVPPPVAVPPTAAPVPATPMVGRPEAADALGAPLKKVSERGIGRRARPLNARRCLPLVAWIRLQDAHSAMWSARRRFSLRDSRP